MHGVLRMFRLLYPNLIHLIIKCSSSCFVSVLLNKVLRKKHLCFLKEMDLTTPRVTPLHRASRRTPHCQTAPLRQTQECGHQQQTAETRTIPKIPHPVRRYEKRRPHWEMWISALLMSGVPESSTGGLQKGKEKLSLHNVIILWTKHVRL